MSQNRHSPLHTTMGGPLQHLPMAARWPGLQGTASPVILSRRQERHSRCTRLSPCQQQRMHGMVLLG